MKSRITEMRYMGYMAEKRERKKRNLDAGTRLIVCDSEKPASRKKHGMWMQNSRAFAKERHPDGGAKPSSIVLPTWLKTTKQERKYRTPTMDGLTCGGPRLSRILGTFNARASPMRMYLCVAVRGRSESSTSSTTTGRLKGASSAARICDRTTAIMASGVTLAGAACDSTMATPGSSPHSSLSTEKTTATRTHSCLTMASSISYGDSCSPPRLISSFPRPVMTSCPSASSCPRSPVSKNQSSSSTDAPPAQESRKKERASASGLFR
mmetsp:Transcript_5161/g.17093  ORF Transcript_5161/g.17093 Transcript_5161/m.17093 type:complete len:266 (-) Transcript_5161:407-1204(-)